MRRKSSFRVLLLLLKTFHIHKKIGEEYITQDGISSFKTEKKEQDDRWPPVFDQYNIYKLVDDK